MAASRRPGQKPSRGGWHDRYPACNGQAQHPAHNREAERAVLGSILRDNATIGDVRQLLAPEDFYADAHQRIFRAILGLVAEGTPADLVTVADQLQKRGEIEDVGRYAYLAELFDATPTTANVAYHAAIVKDSSTRRRLAAFADRMAREARSPTGTIAEAVQRAVQELGTLADGAKAGDKTGLDEIDAEALLAEAPPGALKYLPLLGRDGYFVVGWSHVLAGYPRSGKTELLVASLREWLRRGRRVLFFTEEPREMWRQRLHQHPGPWGGLQLVFALGKPPAEMLARMVAGGEDVVVIDTLRNLGILGEDECDNAAIAAAVAPWVAAGRRHGKTLVLSHHMQKGAGEHGEGISGGHALFGAVDVALELRRDRRPNRRLVKGYARLIQPAELLYEQEKGGAFKVLGDPAGVTLAEVRSRVREALGTEWTKTADVRELLDEPRPSGELVRQALHAEAVDGVVERDPPLSAGNAPGRAHCWRARVSSNDDRAGPGATAPPAAEGGVKSEFQ
jgi:hypothetical protein